MKSFKIFIKKIRNFGILWLTQSFSALGSSMTNFALILWSYQEHGSVTALQLSVRLECGCCWLLEGFRYGICTV